jgi:hypothetical protein
MALWGTSKEENAVEQVRLLCRVHVWYACQ